jgi:hypothetical protein
VSAAGGSHTGILPAVKTRDVDVRIEVATDKVPAGGTFGQVVYLSARRSLTAATDYRVRLRTPPGGGALRLSFVKVVNGSSEVQLGSEVTVPGATYSANQYYSLRFRVTGAAPTTLQAGVWVAGTTEPVAWTNTATDAQPELQGAGAVSIRTYLGSSTTNGPVTFSLRNFLVTDTVGG